VVGSVDDAAGDVADDDATEDAVLRHVGVVVVFGL
jgi:hypothetical protein